MPKKSARLSSYLAEKDPSHLKISHENGTFSFRVKGGQPELDQFFEAIKNEESKKYFEVGFASANVFTILMMQNPEYMLAWIAWHNDYFEKLKTNVTEEEDQAIIKEEGVLYELEHPVETETETKVETEIKKEEEK